MVKAESHVSSYTTGHGPCAVTDWALPLVPCIGTSTRARPPRARKRRPLSPMHVPQPRARVMWSRRRGRRRGQPMMSAPTNMPHVVPVMSHLMPRRRQRRRSCIRMSSWWWRGRTIVRMSRQWRSRRCPSARERLRMRVSPSVSMVVRLLVLVRVLMRPRVPAWSRDLPSPLPLPFPLHPLSLSFPLPLPPLVPLEMRRRRRRRSPSTRTSRRLIPPRNTIRSRPPRRTNRPRRPIHPRSISPTPIMRIRTPVQSRRWGRRRRRTSMMPHLMTVPHLVSVRQRRGRRDRRRAHVRVHKLLLRLL